MEGSALRRQGREDRLFVAPLYLAAPYCFPIRTFTKLADDPLATAVAVMDELGANEWALLQILFAGPNTLGRKPPHCLRRSLPTPGIFWSRTWTKGCLARSYARRFTLLRSYWPPTPRECWPAWARGLHQFQAAHNQLAVRDEAAWARQWPDNEFPSLAHWRRAICSREVLVPGMLLNACELAGIVHLPSPGIPSEHLLRVTNPDPPAAQAGSGRIHRRHRRKHPSRPGPQSRHPTRHPRATHIFGRRVRARARPRCS